MNYDHKIFEVDGIYYVAEFNNHEFSFYVDLEMTKKIIVPYDPFDKPGTTPQRKHFGRVDTKSIFEVKKNITDFVEDVIKSKNLYYFEFAAVDSQKARIYKRIAESINKNSKYFVEESLYRLRFYKKSFEAKTQNELGKEKDCEQLC